MSPHRSVRGFSRIPCEARDNFQIDDFVLYLWPELKYFLVFSVLCVGSY